MAEFQNTIDLLGDEVVSASLIDRSIEVFSDDVLNAVGANGFAGCDLLTSIDLPNVASIGNNCFDSCKKLISVNLPNVGLVDRSAFSGCSVLTSIDLPNVTSIGSYCFLSTKLETIILRNQAVCALSNKNAIPSGRLVTVYVPATLITEYQNATNWSTLYAGGTCNFVAIEGSEYE